MANAIGPTLAIVLQAGKDISAMNLIVGKDILETLLISQSDSYFSNQNSCKLLLIFIKLPTRVCRICRDAVRFSNLSGQAVMGWV